MQLADRQEKENKQVQEVGEKELVEARGGKQWQVNTAEQEEKDVYVCLLKVCSGDRCKSLCQDSFSPHSAVNPSPYLHAVICE